jgi:hypothetical protein
MLLSGSYGARERHDSQPAGKIMEVPGFAEELVHYRPPFLPLSPDIPP